MSKNKSHASIALAGDKAKLKKMDGFKKRLAMTRRALTRPQIRLLLAIFYDLPRTSQVPTPFLFALAKLRMLHLVERGLKYTYLAGAHQGQTGIYMPFEGYWGTTRRDLACVGKGHTKQEDERAE